MLTINQIYFRIEDNYYFSMCENSVHMLSLGGAIMNNKQKNKKVISKNTKGEKIKKSNKKLNWLELLKSQIKVLKLR